MDVLLGFSLVSIQIWHDLSKCQGCLASFFAQCQIRLFCEFLHIKRSSRIYGTLALSIETKNEFLDGCGAF